MHWGMFSRDGDVMSWLGRRSAGERRRGGGGTRARERVSGGRKNVVCVTEVAVGQ